MVYIDRRTGEEVEQPADLVVLCAYPFNNTLLLLTAGIGEPYDPSTGKGVVGKNYCQQTNSSVTVFVDDEINPFIGTGSSPAAIDDFQGDNFDHGGLGFFGGGFISPVISEDVDSKIALCLPALRDGARHGRRKPSAGTTMLSQTPRTASTTRTATTISISIPTYKDAIGRPLVRMTFNYTENDYKMSAFLTEKATAIARVPPTPGSSELRNLVGAITASTMASLRITPAARSWGPTQRQA